MATALISRFNERFNEAGWQIPWQNWRAGVGGYLIGIGGVAVITWMVQLLDINSRHPTFSSLYLIVVLGTATAFGNAPSILAAVLSFLSFDWFYVDPPGQLMATSLNGWLVLFVFLLTAVVTSQLATAQRTRAEEARRQGREALALFTLSTLIAADSVPENFIPSILDRFGVDLQIVGIVVSVVGRAGALESLVSAGLVEVETPAEAEVPEVIDVPLRLGDNPIGVLRVVRPSNSPVLTTEQQRFLEAVGQQVAMALERVRLQAEAADAAALRRADELKSALLSSISHDLRTPIALIKASAESLHQKEIVWTDEERDGFAEAIEIETDRLDHLVRNLLDASLIESGTVRPERQYYPLSSIVDDILSRLRPLLSQHPVTVDIPEDLPLVYVDYVVIDRVLTNLLENATRHTPDQTPMRIEARAGDDLVVVTVADEGPGIPDADLTRIFEKFFRGESARRRSVRGSGLGLTIVRGLIEAHGGRVWAENRAVSGAAISFTLPLPELQRARPTDNRMLDHELVAVPL